MHGGTRLSAFYFSLIFCVNKSLNTSFIMKLNRQFNSVRSEGYTWQETYEEGNNAMARDRCNRIPYPDHDTKKEKSNTNIKYGIKCRRKDKREGQLFPAKDLTRLS